MHVKFPKDMNTPTDEIYQDYSDIMNYWEVFKAITTGRLPLDGSVIYDNESRILPNGEFIADEMPE